MCSLFLLKPLAKSGALLHTQSTHGAQPLTNSSELGRSLIGAFQVSSEMSVAALPARAWPSTGPNRKLHFSGEESEAA